MDKHYFADPEKDRHGTVRLSGGSGRETFTYRGEKLTQPQLTNIINSINGFKVSKSVPKSGGKGFDYIIVSKMPPSQSAMQYASPATKILTLEQFVWDNMSQGQYEQFEDGFYDIHPVEESKQSSPATNSQYSKPTKTIKPFNSQQQLLEQNKDYLIHLIENLTLKDSDTVVAIRNILESR